MSDAGPAFERPSPITHHHDHHDHFDTSTPSFSHPTPLERRRSSRTKPSKHARARQPQPEIISSMIDSLDHFSQSPEREKQPWQQPAYSHVRHDSRDTIEDEFAAPAPAGPGIFDRPYEELDNPHQAWQSRSRRSSQVVEGGPPPSGGLRRLLTSASTRSRTSATAQSVYQPDLDVDRVSLRSFSSVQPEHYQSPPTSTTSYRSRQTPTPQRSLRRRKSRQNLSADIYESPLSRVIPADRPRNDTRHDPGGDVDYSRRGSVVSSVFSARNHENGHHHAVQPPPMSQKPSEEPVVDTPTLRKTSRSVASSRRESPLTGTIADSIPTRTSSLHQTDKKGDADRKKSKIKTWSGRKISSSKKKKQPGLNEESVLEELGEDDETVKRIRELKQQREARKRLEVTTEQTSVPPQFSAILSPVLSKYSRSQASNSNLSHRAQHLDVADRVRHDRLSPIRHNFAGSATSSTSQLRAPSDYDYGEALMALNPEEVIRPASVQATRPHLSTSVSAPATRPRAASVDIRRQSIFSNGRVSMDERRHASIDVDVDAFMNAPRVNRSVRHPKTSRLISFADVGDPRGHPVFVCVGMGLTRFVSAFYDDLATTLGLRLITPERPGVGRSQAYTDRDTPGPMSWHQDVHAICMALNIDSFSLLAHSAGAVFALATALILPHLVKGKIYLLAPWIPPSQFEVTTAPAGANGIPDANGEVIPTGTLPRSQRFLRVLPVSFLKAANSSFLGINTNSMGSTSQSPTASPSRPKSRRRSISGNAFGNSAARDSYFSPPPVQDYATRPSVDADAIIRSANAEAAAAAALPPPASLFPSSATNPRSPMTSPIRTARGPVSPPIVMSATAFPTDTDLVLASTHLSAAQHTADNPEPFLSASPPPVPVDPKREALYTATLLQRVWAASTRDSNPADDLLVCLERNRPVGFKYVDVRKRLVVLHGTEDKRVDLRNVRWLVARVNAARRRRREAARIAVEVSAGKRVAAAKTAAELGSSGSPLDPRSAWKGGKSKDYAGSTTTLGGGAGSVVGLGISGVIKDGEEGDGVEADDEGDCELRVLEGQGHGLMAVAGVMGDVLAEIAQEHVGFGNKKKIGDGNGVRKRQELR